MKGAFLFLTCTLMMSLAFGQGKEVRLSTKDKAKTATFSTTKDKGTLLSIEVSDNSGSTGYTWEMLKNNAQVTEFVGKSFISPKEPMPGAPGVSVYTFKVTGKPGTSVIQLGQSRPGDKTGTAQNVETFTIRVKAPVPKKKVVVAPQAESTTANPAPTAPATPAAPKK